MQDLRLLRAARSLLGAGLGPQRLGQALRRLSMQLPAGRALANVKLALVDQDVVAIDGRRTWSATSGQLLLPFAAAPSARVTRLPDRHGDDSDDDEDAYRLFTRGAALEKHSPGEAKATYREVLRLDPTAVPALVNLGRLEQQSGRLTEAERLYQKALSLEPDERSAAFNLGVLAEESGDTRLAIRRYEHALRLAPDLADAHQRLARLQASLGNREGARRHTLRYRALLRR